jgi:hypothetical protein
MEKCPLKCKQDMKEERREVDDFRSCGNILLVCWNNNSVVTAGTMYKHVSLCSV